jgi:hypothetical protein
MNLSKSSKAQLLDYATVELGLELPETMSRDEMISQIKLATGQGDALAAADAAPEKKAQPKTIKIQLHTVEGQTGASDVPVMCNGKSYLLRRGVEIDAPPEVVDILKNAKQMKYATRVGPDGDRTLEKREVQSYPFSYL